MTIDCPACGTTLVCSGCGEDVANIVEQSSIAQRVKELEELLNENTERLEYWKNLAIHWRIKE
jgi:transcription initiation factor IIE alpha subunit